MTAEAILCINSKDVFIEVGLCRDHRDKPGGGSLV